MPSRPIIEQALVEAVCAGDDQAVAVFVNVVRPRLERLARFRGITAEDAEEIAQDTMLAVLTQLRGGQFEGRSQLTSWIHAIFERRAVDHHRKRRRHDSRSVSLEQFPADGRGLARSLGPSDDARTTLLVRAALAALEPRQRLVLLLNLNEGLPSREIATMLRLGVKTTEALLTSAKKAFRVHVRVAQERSRPRRLTG